MHKYQIIKLLAASLITTSSIAVTIDLVSCSNNHPTPNAETWAQFQVSAHRESAANIIYATKPNIWPDDIPDMELKISNYSVDDGHQQIRLDITRNHNNFISSASFNITDDNIVKYNVDDWECNVQPHFSEYDNFQIKALQETAVNLLDFLKPWTIPKDYHWKYGTLDQATWSKVDEPEWDIYGWLTKHDSYKGMAGKPKSDTKTKTITAIISKVGHEGIYDADPIKAVIQYYPGVEYNIKNWTFSPVEQLQSFEKMKDLFEARLKLAYTKDEIEPPLCSVNWMTITGAPEVYNQLGLHHDPKFHIRDAMHDEQDPDPLWGIYNPVFVEEPKPKVYVGNMTCKIVLQFLQYDVQYHLNLFFRFYYANSDNPSGGDPSGGGTAFNDTWDADKKPI